MLMQNIFDSSVAVSLAIVALLQALCTGFDEMICHRKRGLPHWERIGHPVDSFFLTLTLAYAGYFSFSPSRLVVFGAMAILSCLIVSKDEFVHAQQCDGFESWLHALMFMLHPVLLMLVGISWRDGSAQIIRSGLPIIVGLVGSYQFIYWNIFYGHKDK
jgi:hypothetical protein